MLTHSQNYSRPLCLHDTTDTKKTSRFVKPRKKPFYFVVLELHNGGIR